MAAPNIVSVATLTGKVVAQTLATTSAVALLVTTSDKVNRIVSLYAANIHATSTCTISVSVSKATVVALANTISVPAQSSLVAITKDEPIYLEEAAGLLVQTNQSSGMSVVCSYEEIS
jgi:hypothetical protein